MRDPLKTIQYLRRPLTLEFSLESPLQIVLLYQSVVINSMVHRYHIANTVPLTVYCFIHFSIGNFSNDPVSTARVLSIFGAVFPAPTNNVGPASSPRSLSSFRLAFCTLAVVPYRTGPSASAGVRPVEAIISSHIVRYTPGLT